MSWRTRFVSTLMLAVLATGCGTVHEHASEDGGISGTDAGDVPRAQAAVTFNVTPAPGQTCSETDPQVSVPSAYNGSVQAELSCDLSAGCKPDGYVVVDGDRGTTVACTVSAAAGNFNVLLSLTVDGSATNELSAQFGLNGAISPTGGTVSINESNSVAKGGGSDPNCTLTIAAPHGVVKRGAIWGSFDCSNFRDERNIGDTGCHLQGQFLFENCDH